MDKGEILKYYVVSVGMCVIINGMMFRVDENSNILYCIDKKDISYECQQKEGNDLADYLTPRLEISDTTNTSVVSMRLIS